MIDRAAEREAIFIEKSQMTKEQAAQISNATGKIVVLVDDIEKMKSTAARKVEEVGDGKAEFFADPTPEEELEHERAEKGTKKWYDRLKIL